MDHTLRNLLKIPYERLDDINDILLNPDMRVIKDFLEVVEKYGTPEEINRKAEQARQLPAADGPGRSHETRIPQRPGSG
jgi:hypothetical protein